MRPSSDLPTSLDFGWGRADLKGFELVRKPTVPEWGSAWGNVNANRKFTKWLRGWLWTLVQDGVVGEEVHNFIFARDVTLGTVQNEASLVRAYQGHYEYVGQVSFSHHDVVAKLEPARRKHWLQQVVDADLTCRDLREMTAEERETAKNSDPIKMGLERLLRWRDGLEETLYQLPEGPWGPDVRQALKHIEQAIAVYREKGVPVDGKLAA